MELSGYIEDIPNGEQSMTTELNTFSRTLAAEFRTELRVLKETVPAEEYEQAALELLKVYYS